MGKTVFMELNLAIFALIQQTKKRLLIPKPLQKKLVEVAGIEPASKEQIMSESTCLAIFDLSSGGGRWSDPQEPVPWS